MKVLVTGCSGYIGSHLCKLLSKDPNIELYGLDKSVPVHTSLNFDLQNINWTNYWSHEINTTIFDCIIHLAAEVSVPRSVGNPIPYYQTNVVGTLNLLSKIRTKKFIYGSTGSAAHLSNPYSVSKKAAEEIVEQHCKTHSIEYSIIRLNNVLGSDSLPIRKDTILAHLINSIETKSFMIYGTDYDTKDGTCERDYTHVIDVCEGIKRVINSSSNQLEEFGTGQATTVKEVVEGFQKLNHCDFKIIPMPRRPGDVARSVVKTPSKFFKPNLNITEMLSINL